MTTASHAPYAPHVTSIRSRRTRARLIAARQALEAATAAIDDALAALDDATLAGRGSALRPPSPVPHGPMPAYLRVPDVARILSVGEGFVRRACRDGSLPGAKQLGKGGPWVIPEPAVLTYLRDGAVTP